MMQTVEEVIAYLKSEQERLHALGTYEDDVTYLQMLIDEITA